MAFQNSYNNYISRQKKNSTGLFKEKIKNSLGGVAVGNNTTLKSTNNVTPQMGSTTVTPNVLGKSTTTNINKSSNGVPHVNLTTPTNTLTTPTGSRSVSNPYQMNAHINANPIQPTILKGQIGGVKDNLNTNNTGTSINNTLTTQPTNVIQPITTPNIVPDTTPTTDGTIIDNSATGGTTGMMSLADINNALSIEGVNNSANQEDSLDVMVKELTGEEKPSMEFTEDDYKTMEQLAKSPMVQSSARASDKTPQQMAQELLEQQKAQLQKDWEQKKQELELQMKQAKESYQQSITDANNTYNDTDEELKLNRYQQQEDLAVDAQRRGIQYSPEQLALENVANINLNKNLADASKKRNELLNNLQIQINQSMENIVMGLQSATNTYNSSVSDLMSDYQKQMMDWAYNDQQTADERAWQEKQTLADQAFQKEMADLQNKWQAEQNALDRATYGSSRSGSGGYSGYGRSYYSSYRPWRNYSYGRYGYARNNWKNYSGSQGSYSNDVDLSTAEGQEAVLSTAKQASTDLFNAMNYGSPQELNAKGQLYTEEMGNLINEVKGKKNSKKVVDELEKTYNTALNHLFNEAYGRASGNAYKVGDTYIQPKTPYSEEYINSLKKTRMQDKVNFMREYGLKDEDGKTKGSSMLMASGLLNPEYFDPRYSTIYDPSKDKSNKNRSSRSSSSSSRSGWRTLTNDEKRKVAQAKHTSIAQMAQEQRRITEQRTKAQKQGGVYTNNMRKQTNDINLPTPKLSTTTKKKTTKKVTSTSKKNTIKFVQGKPASKKTTKKNTYKYGQPKKTTTKKKTYTYGRGKNTSKGTPLTTIIKNIFKKKK